MLQGFNNRESMICCLLGERVEIPKLGPPASLKNYSLFNTSAMRDKKKFTNELATMEIDEDIMEIILRCSEASEKVAEMLSRSNLQSGNFSKAGFQNCQGEEVNRMDVLSNELFLKYLSKCVSVHTIISEENDLPVKLSKPFGAKYVVAIDPLDGSSNIDVNVAVGSIFGIYRTFNRNAQGLSGHNLVASGYVMYGSSVQLVLCDGKSSSLFVYDNSLRRFVLVRDRLVLPEKGNIYSINEASMDSFDTQVQSFLRNCKSKSTMSARYIGSLVADFHRNLFKGGLYLYPSTEHYPSGKLRLLYECLPLALIAESCGGSSVSGGKATLSMGADSIHDRSELIVGSSELVNEFENAIEVRYLKLA